MIFPWHEIREFVVTQGALALLAHSLATGDAMRNHPNASPEEKQALEDKLGPMRVQQKELQMRLVQLNNQIETRLTQAETGAPRLILPH
jgi:hypothetical protein